MGKLLAAMNVTLDGCCDHTAMGADEEIHRHYSELLEGADTLIYGRKTYQLMENHWPAVVRHPTGVKPTDAFAVLIDGIQKIVYSRTLAQADWNNATLKREIVPEEIVELKRRTVKDIVVGSPSMIRAFARLGLIDEYQPIILGSGMPLFADIGRRVDLRLLRTKRFGCGAIVLYYAPAGNHAHASAAERR